MFTNEEYKKALHMFVSNGLDLTDEEIDYVATVFAEVEGISVESKKIELINQLAFRRAFIEAESPTGLFNYEEPSAGRSR